MVVQQYSVHGNDARVLCEPSHLSTGILSRQSNKYPLLPLTISLQPYCTSWSGTTTISIKCISRTNATPNLEAPQFRAVSLSCPSRFFHKEIDTLTLATPRQPESLRDG